MASLGTPAALAPREAPTPERVAAPWAHQADHRFAWLILACTLLGMLLGAADQTIVSAAMPRILRDLSGWSQYAWITSAYLLCATVTIPLYGKLADLYESKWIFLFGLGLFIVASALCGTAQTMQQLMVLRALQGLGAGALSPVGIVIMTAFVTPERRIGLQAGTSGMLLFATVAGPIIGGWLADKVSWRAAFFINIPLGLLVLVVMALLVPRLRKQHKQVRIDYLGVLLLVLAVAPILLLVSIPAQQRTFVQAIGVLPLVLGVAAIVVIFIVHELRHPDPIIDPRLLRRRTIAGSALATVLLSAITLASLIYIPLYAQGVLGHTSTGGGLILAPLMLATISGRLIANWLREHLDHIRRLAAACLAPLLAGAGLLVTLSPRSETLHSVAAMVLLGVGLGAANTVLFAVALSGTRPIRFGEVTGALLFLRSLGGAAILGVLGSFLTTRFAIAVGHDLPQRYRYLLHTRLAVALDNPRLLLTRQQLLTQGQSPRPVLSALRTALDGSLHEIFAVILAMAALAFVTLLIFPQRINRQAGAQVAMLAEGAFAPLLPSDLTADRVPPPARLALLWGLICHIIYWRHGAVRFGAARGTTRTFNGFEEMVDLPSSLGEVVGTAFAHLWPTLRSRCPLDRYRVEEVVYLLWQRRHEPGGVAVCGGEGDGLAQVLAALVVELGLPHRVYRFPAVTQAGADSADLSDEAQQRIARGAAALVVCEGPLSHAVSALPPSERLLLCHIESEGYEETQEYLRHLLPRCHDAAAVVIGHFNDSGDGARRAALEAFGGAEGAGEVGPLPQVTFIVLAGEAPSREREGAEGVLTWSETATSTAYSQFLLWVAAELATCQEGSESGLDGRIKAALERLALPHPAAVYLRQFAATLE